MDVLPPTPLAQTARHPRAAQEGGEGGAVRAAVLTGQVCHADMEKGKGKKKGQLSLQQSLSWTISATEWLRVALVHRCEPLILFS